MFAFLGLRDCDYIVEIKTGDSLGAGTNANVWIILYDENSNATPSIKLDQLLKNNFERGSTDVFQISKSDTINLKKDGQVAKIEFLRDDHGNSSDWYVDKIEVRNKNTGSTFLFPVNRWVNANYHYKIKHLDTSLPQHEQEDLETREQYLIEKTKNYIMDQKFPKEFPNGPVQVKSLPVDEKFSFNDRFSIAAQTAKLQGASKIINLTHGKWKSIADISTIFAPPVFPKPETASMWMDDVNFGRQRIAGINNSLIELVKTLPQKFPVTDDLVKPFLGGLTLQEAINQKRLFICDLQVLERLPVKENRMVGFIKLVSLSQMCVPIALFFVDMSGRLRPVAIQLFQKPGPNNTIFTPRSPSLTWTLVKMWYNNADSAYHQALTHLGFTHLLMESFSLATQRNLSQSHPVYKILAPHFLYIMAINSLAVSELVSDGGWVNRTMNYGNKGMYALIVKKYIDWRLDVDGTLPEDLKRRGLDDPNVLPNYHYRDDAMLLHNAINKYVHDYLTLYYTSTELVASDHELQSWAQELVKEKNFAEGNGTLSIVEQIQQIVTSVIFICSVGHAAANFGQYDMKAVMTEQDVLKDLPDKENTLEILTIAKVLSTKGTKSLGDFEVQYIVDPKAKVIVDSFACVIFVKGTLLLFEVYIQLSFFFFFFLRFAFLRCDDFKGVKLCAPIALFFVGISGQLKPVAIQLFQKPGPKNPIFTPRSPSLTWTLVKMWFNNADCAYHQALTHLGFTHLLMESFSLATQRNLSHSHPVYKILEPHFLYIMAINSLAVTQLVNDGGWVDMTMNYGNKGMYALIVKAYKDWRLDVDGTLPEELKRRGVDNPDVLPGYHYRDDAMLLYNAINKYVHDYLKLYYSSPELVSDDHELQSWAQELVKERNFDKGGMGIKGIPGNGKLSTVEQIQQIVTSVIFICSVGHAATNFPQYDEYAFPPVYPATLLGKPPTDPKAIVTEQDILKCLPNKEMTLEIMTMTKILSTKGTKSLGDFEVEYIVDPKAVAVVERYTDWRLDVDGTLPEDLKRRGLDDPNVLPNYHYRDDAMLLYNAINKYVHDHLALYYTSTELVASDHELQSWAQLLVKEKNFAEGNGTLSTVEQVQQIVTSVIFICSVVHAAASFGQYDEYGFPPNYPLTLLGEPPVDTKAVMTEQDVLKALPDKKKTL
ncbi:hypothetical protein Btru_044801 [Bulinus truncatus]|nr:hypothetical protein Btru_044801 [Bulinus truncatus]